MSNETSPVRPGAPSKPAWTVVPIAPQRAFEDIAAQIRALIVGGKLRPGDRLPSERDLSVRFNVSRSTLREGLRALELAGILELRKGATGGAFVRHGHSEVVAKGLTDLYHLGAITPGDLTEARIAITECVLRAACQRITPEELLALEVNAEEAAQAEAANDFATETRLHQHFHVLLARSSRNPIFIANMEGIMEIVRLFVEAIGAGRAPYVVPSRRRLLAHLKARDADAAIAEMVKTLKKLHREYMVLWEDHARRQQA